MALYMAWLVDQWITERTAVQWLGQIQSFGTGVFISWFVIGLPNCIWCRCHHELQFAKDITPYITSAKDPKVTFASVTNPVFCRHSQHVGLIYVQLQLVYLRPNQYHLALKMVYQVCNQSMQMVKEFSLPWKAPIAMMKCRWTVTYGLRLQSSQLYNLAI